MNDVGGKGVGARQVGESVDVAQVIGTRGRHYSLKLLEEIDLMVIFSFSQTLFGTFHTCAWILSGMERKEVTRSGFHFIMSYLSNYLYS